MLGLYAVFNSASNIAIFEGGQLPKSRYYPQITAYPLVFQVFPRSIHNTTWVMSLRAWVICSF